VRSCAIIFAISFFAGSSIFAADDVSVVASSQTIEAMKNHPLCTQILTHIAHENFTPQGDKFEIGVGLHLDEIAHLFTGTPIEKEKFREKFGTLSQFASSQPPTPAKTALDDTVRTMISDQSILPFGGISLWFCMGLNCSSRKPPSEHFVPFNYVVRDVENIPANVEKFVQPTGDKIPYPSIGLSRVEVVFLDKPDLSSDGTTSKWLAAAIRESNVYVMHQLLSRWLSLAHFGKGVGIKDPIYEKFVRQAGPEDRVYILDSVFFHTLMAGSKFQVELAALQALGQASQSMENEFRKKAFQQVLDHTTVENRNRFKEKISAEVSAENIFEIANQLTKRFKRFSNRFQIEDTLQTYNDLSLGIVPVRVTALRSPSEAQLNSPLANFPKPKIKPPSKPAVEPQLRKKNLPELDTIGDAIVLLSDNQVKTLAIKAAQMAFVHELLTYYSLEELKERAAQNQMTMAEYNDIEKRIRFERRYMFSQIFRHPRSASAVLTQGQSKPIREILNNLGESVSKYDFSMMNTQLIRDSASKFLAKLSSGDPQFIEVAFSKPEGIPGLMPPLVQNLYEMEFEMDREIMTIFSSISPSIRSYYDSSGTP
jgi:hypothetical protein